MNLGILDEMFPHCSIPETLWDGIDLIGDAIRAEERFDYEAAVYYYEAAGYFFLNKKFQYWGTYFLNYSMPLNRHVQRLENEKMNLGKSIKNKNKSQSPFAFSKFIKLLQGWLQ